MRKLVIVVVAFMIEASACFAQNALPPNFEALRKRCAADVQKVCADVSPGPALHQCMVAHQDQISSDCRAAMAEADKANTKVDKPPARKPQ